MTYPENRTPLQSDDMAKLHPSTWEAECKQLRRDYSLMQIDRNNLRSLLNEAEAKADELHDRLEAAQSETRARVARLEAIVLDYRNVLHSAKAGRDLHCGFYVAKEYRFTRDQIDSALAKVSAALEAKP